MLKEPLTGGPAFPAFQPLPGRRSWSQNTKEGLILNDGDPRENTTNSRWESPLGCSWYCIYWEAKQRGGPDHQKLRVICQGLHPCRWSHCKVKQGIRPALATSPQTRGLPCEWHRQGDTIIVNGTSSQKIPQGTIFNASRHIQPTQDSTPAKPTISSPSASLGDSAFL